MELLLHLGVVGDVEEQVLQRERDVALEGSDEQRHAPFRIVVGGRALLTIHNQTRARARTHTYTRARSRMPSLAGSS